MNWKLIFLLSLFGLGMAIATVWWIPGNIELAFWLVIFLINAYLIAKYATGKYFLTGFLVSLVNSVYIVAAHVMFYAPYIANHAMEEQMSGRMPWHNHPRIGMIIMGPLFGVAFGLIQGLFAWVASKVLNRQEVAA